MPMPGGGGSSGAIRAGAAFVEIFTKPNYKGLDDMANRLRRFGAGLAKIGAFTAGAGAALLTPLAALFKGGLDMAGEMQDLQDQFGLTAEGISKLGYAAQVAGAGLEELEPILKGLAKANTDGRPLDEFALDFADSLLAIENPSERARAAMDNLGKGGLKFLKVAGDLKGLFGEAPILNQQTLDAADSFGQSLNKIGVAAKAALLPFASYAAGAAESVAVFARENAGVLRIVAAVGAGLVAAGTAITMLGGTFIVAGIAIKATLFTLGAVGAIVAFIASPLGVLTASMVAFVGILNQLTGGGVIDFFKGWGETLGEMGTVFQDTMKGITDALKGGSIALAAKVAMAGLEAVWELGLARLLQKWNKFKTQIERKITQEVPAAANMFFGDVWTGFELLLNNNLRGGKEAGAIIAANRDKNLGIINAERDRAIRNKEEDKALEQISPSAQARVDAARAEFGKLMAESAELAKKKDKLAEAVAPGLLASAVGSVKGAFQISNAAQQFGSGDTVGKQLVVEARNQTQQAKMTNEKLDTLTSAVMQSTPKFW